MERILLCAHARQTVSVVPVVVAAEEGSQKLRTRDTTVAPREQGAGGGGVGLAVGPAARLPRVRMHARSGS